MIVMEAASTSEMSVNFYQTTRRYNPEDSDLQDICRPTYSLHIAMSHVILMMCETNTLGKIVRFEVKRPEGTEYYTRCS
jgi:hypothetical protein